MSNCGRRENKRGSRKQLCSLIVQLTASVPVVVYGPAGPAEAVAQDVMRVATGRHMARVETWLRKPTGIGGTGRELVPGRMIIIHGAGDVEIQRVCVSVWDPGLLWLIREHLPCLLPVPWNIFCH